MNNDVCLVPGNALFFKFIILGRKNQNGNIADKEPKNKIADRNVAGVGEIKSFGFAFDSQIKVWESSVGSS